MESSSIRFLDLHFLMSMSACKWYCTSKFVIFFFTRAHFIESSCLMFGSAAVSCPHQRPISRVWIAHIPTSRNYLTSILTKLPNACRMSGKMEAFFSLYCEIAKIQIEWIRTNDLSL